MGNKRKIESILFSAGKNLAAEEIAKLSGVNIEETEALLLSLKKEYEEKDTSLRVVRYGDEWKMTVRPEFTDVMDKIATQTDLSKTVMETLAVIAYKAPALQSDVIKIRTNKAYDHITELERLGYITRVKHGRSKLIRLAPKFFEYFDIPEDQLRESFKNVREMEEKVSNMEEQLKDRKKKLQIMKTQLKKTETKEKEKLEAEIKKLDRELAKMPKIALLDEKGKAHKLQIYDAIQKTNIVPYSHDSSVHTYTENIDGLQIVESETGEKETHWGDFTIYKVVTKKSKEKESRAEDEPEDTEKSEDELESQEDIEESEKDEGGDEEDKVENETAESEDQEGTGEGSQESGTNEKSEDFGAGNLEQPQKSKPTIWDQPNKSDKRETEKPKEKLEEKALKIPKLKVEKEKIKKIEYDEKKRLFAKGVPKELEPEIDKRANELMGIGPKPDEEKSGKAEPVRNSETQEKKQDGSKNNVSEVQK